MAKILTDKDFSKQLQLALAEYRNDVDIDEHDPETIFIDGFITAFNLDKMPSRTALRSILHVAFKGENVDINKALDRIKEHYKL